MDYREQILKTAPQEMREKLKNTAICCEDPLERECRLLNELEGSLNDYDCNICKNKGVTYIVKWGCVVAQACKCMTVRSTVARVRKSGLQNVLGEYTFDKYLVTEPWQESIKRDALDFVANNDKQWFFIGGQVGAGKTHICTAIVGEFINRGYSAKYMLWRDEAVKLKSVVNDDEYAPLINQLKTVPVLYIDDFLKTSLDRDGKRVLPTQGDINLAFEILNYRYNNNAITIISSERTIKELIDCDEAVGSRICQRTKKHAWGIKKDASKNYRLR